MKLISYASKAWVALLVLTFGALMGNTGVRAADDVGAVFLQQALEECRQNWEEAGEKCSKIYIQYYTTDPETGKVKHAKCVEDKNEAFDKCADADKLMKSAKYKQFREINADILAKLETAQDKSNNKLATAIDKCMKKKTQSKIEACVKKANEAAEKRIKNINKKYLKKLKPVK
jgi:hypothetical protein